MVIADAALDIVVTLDKYVGLQWVVNPFYILKPKKKFDKDL